MTIVLAVVSFMLGGIWVLLYWIFSELRDIEIALHQCVRPLISISESLPATKDEPEDEEIDAETALRVKMKLRREAWRSRSA